jgi:hypothetical protein
MINNKYFPFRLSASLTLVAFMLCQVSLPAQAQSNNQSDVTGLNVTNSDISGGRFAPSPGGRGGSFSVTIIRSINQSAVNVFSQLSGGSLVVPGGVSIPPRVQQTLLILLFPDSVPNNSASFNPKAIALILSGGEGSRTAPFALRLVNSLRGLFGRNSHGRHHARIEVNPSKLLVAVSDYDKAQMKIASSNSGIKVNPSELLAAVKAYNDLINNSSAEFLNNPPPELLAIRSVLLQLMKGVK